jgi:hypothetical protein
VIVLQTEEGRKLLADLGPTSQFQTRPLNRGDRVTIQGHAAQVKGRPILMADQVTAGGRTYTVPEEAFQPPEPRTQPRPDQNPRPAQRPPVPPPAMQ